MNLKLSSNVTLPIQIASQAIALFGIRGSGKTNTAGALAEELLDRNQPIVVIDPTDAWWGLRAGRDGSPGYQVFIIGGPHGDIPLQDTDGKVIAEFLVNEHVPAVLSLRHLRKAAQRRFVTEFCEELYHLKGRDQYRTPLTVFIDEAPLFVPQKVMGETARTVGAVEDLIARGRNAGFGVVLISQRSATINADVRTQADTIICHRVTAPLDRRAISDWFEENATTDRLKEILQSLATLKDGEAWIWAPALGIMQRTQMRLRRTYDSSATPKIGEALRPPKKLAEIDLDKLKGRLAESVERSKADDPKELKKQFAELKRQLASQKPAEKPVEIIKEVPGPPLLSPEEKDLLNRINDLLGGLSSNLASIRELFGEIERLNQRLTKAQGGTSPHIALLTRRAAEPLSKTSYKITAKVQAPRQPAESNGVLAGGQRRILTVLAQYPDGRTKSQVAILAGYAQNGGGFNNYLSGLRTSGYIQGADQLRITDQGMDALGHFEELPTGEALLNYWMGKLSKAEKLVLSTLHEAYPQSMTKEDVAQVAGYEASGGGFNNALSKLRTLELIEGRGELRASDALFG